MASFMMPFPFSVCSEFAHPSTIWNPQSITMSTAQTAISVVKSGIIETIYSITLSIPLFPGTRCGEGNILSTSNV